MDDLVYNLQTEGKIILFSKKHIKRFPKLNVRFTSVDVVEVSCSYKCLEKFKELVEFIIDQNKSCDLKNVDVLMGFTKKGYNIRKFILTWLIDWQLITEMAAFANEYDLTLVKEALAIILVQHMENNSVEEIYEKFIITDVEQSSDNDWSDFI